MTEVNSAGAPATAGAPGAGDTTFPKVESTEAPVRRRGSGSGGPAAGTSRRPRWVLWLAGVVVLVAAGVLAWLLLGGSDTVAEDRETVTTAAGFPTDIPLADGSLVESKQLGDRAYTAMVEVSGGDQQDAALATLEEAGFVRTGEIERDGVRSYSLISGQYGVTLVMKESGGKPVVAYTIAPR